MEPQPQLQPINPRPRIDFAEPTGRPLELKPGPRPLDLRPRPSGRPQLDIKYGPASPAEAAAQRSNPLGNPLNVAQPVINNPLGLAPGKGIVQAAAAFAEAATDPATFGVPAEEFEPSGLPQLPLPNAFSPDALQPGPELVPGQEEVPGSGNDPNASYIVFLSGKGFDTQATSTADRSGVGSVGGLVIRDRQGFGAHSIGVRFSQTGEVFSGGGTATTSANNVSSWSITNIQRLDPGTDPVQQAAQEPEYGPNTGRSATAPAAIAPSVRPGAPFKTAPVPTLAAPAPATPDLPRIAPVNPPQIDPDVPYLDPAQPFKFPPVPSIPSFPGDDPTVPDAPTKRPPPVQFPPSQPGITGPELVPIKPPVIPIIFIPPLRRDDCLTGDEYRRGNAFLRDLIEKILDRLLNDCKDLCSDAQLTRSFCEEVNGVLVPRQEFLTYSTLAPALGFLSREIAALKAIADPCLPDAGESVAPILLASASSIEGTTVFYVDILPTVRQVELIITGQIPQTIRLYDTTLSGEQQGKFGAITLAYPGVVGGNAPDAFHQWAWTRRTAFYVGEPIRADRKIRIQLKPLLTWVLYDTGLRS